MDTFLQDRFEQLARESAGQAETTEDVNGLLRLMMKLAPERALDTEMDVHLGRKSLAGGADDSAVDPSTANEDSPAAS